MGTTLIKNGRIITAADDYFADILVEDDRIKLIGQNLQMKADRAIDAGGKYVIPALGRDSGRPASARPDPPRGGTPVFRCGAGEP